MYYLGDVVVSLVSEFKVSVDNTRFDTQNVIANVYFNTSYASFEILKSSRLHEIKTVLFKMNTMFEKKCRGFLFKNIFHLRKLSFNLFKSQFVEHFPTFETFLN